jgi:hypothetical protein
VSKVAELARKEAPKKQSIEKREYIAYLDQKLGTFSLVFEALEVVLLKVMTKDLKIQSLDKHLEKRWGSFITQARKSIIKKKKQ